METINDFFISLSIALTIPFLFMCVEIYKLWLPSLRKKPEPSRVLAKGIIFGFASNFFDNLYWGITWFLIMIGNKYAMDFVFWGAFINIFLRQGGGIFAAHHHLKAAEMIHGRKTTAHHKWYWGLGAAAFVILFLIKHH